MIIQCEACSKKFIVKDSDIPKEGRMVQCGNCSTAWHQLPALKITKIAKEPNISKKKVREDLSVDAIKASDGKTYKFLGSQWAELLPSGKTGLFAKKKIGKELDKVTGRKVEKSFEKKSKRELNPSSENIDAREKLSDAYKSRDGIGFFGYIFLIIIVGFSIVGILKTFETDLINYFPEMEYVFEILDEQLIYLAESVKNIIVVFNDLMDSY